MALNFDEFQKVVESAQQADAIKSDLKRSLKKVASALENLQAALGEMDTILADDYVSAPKVRKTRTSSAGAADGAAPRKPGRPKKTAA
jgi:Skp family chaperone for outer membrane proteins